MPDNPNEYNDSEYQRITSIMFNDAAISRYVSELWMAGASEQNIVDEFENVVRENILELEPSEEQTQRSTPKKKPKARREVIDEHTGQRSAD